MPKVKTHSACKKRFKKTANGKIRRACAFRRHHSWSKNSKQIRNLRKGGYIDESQHKQVKSLMPY